MARFLDACKFVPTAGGTTDWNVSAAATGFQTPSAAGAIDGQIYRYRAESSDLSQWELGYGAISASGTILARTTVIANSAGTAAKIGFSAAPVVGVVPVALDLREKLDANRTYFVRTDGSDGNSGLANTAGGAFLTVQKAIDLVSATLDCGIYDVTIQVAAGTYGGQVRLKSFIGSGNVIVVGDTVTPSNVVFSAGGSTVALASNQCIGNYSLQGFRCSNATGAHFQFDGQCYIRFQNVDFAATTDRHLGVSGGAILVASGNYSISGGALNHIRTGNGPSRISVSQITVTLTGTPAFSSSYAESTENGYIGAYGATFTGSATGKRYNAVTGGGINVGGGGANYFPGNAAGTSTSPGWYG